MYAARGECVGVMQWLNCQAWRCKDFPGRIHRPGYLCYKESGVVCSLAKITDAEIRDEKNENE